jgi:hypothetical protein
MSPTTRSAPRSVHVPLCFSLVEADCGALQSKNRENTMRIALITAIAAIGLGFIGMSGVSAAPASGTVISDTAASGLTRVDWHHCHHWHWHHGHHVCD